MGKRSSLWDFEGEGVPVYLVSDGPRLSDAATECFIMGVGGLGMTDAELLATGYTAADLAEADAYRKRMAGKRYQMHGPVRGG